MSDKNLLKNMSWLTLISGIERLAATLQTILVARSLGIADYGIYGLIFGTIGVVASITGLQMGLTATVYVARYKVAEKEKAAFVLNFVNRFGLAVALLFFISTAPFAAMISSWLLGSSSATNAIVAGCLLISFSILSGVQDGVIQGFEDFRSVALTRLATTVITLVCIYPAGIKYGLLGSMSVVLLGLIIKYFLLIRKTISLAQENDLPKIGAGIRGWDLMWGFSLPSMLVSMLVGAIGWSGTFLLSREADGFEALAIVNTGLQWRGPIFLLTSSIASVAIPAISRHYQAENHSAIKSMQHQVLLYNGGFALIVSIALILVSPMILMLYGPGFTGGEVVFSLVVASAIPQVVANVYLQHLVAKGRTWEQLIMHLWLVAPLGIGFVAVIPRFHSHGFALVNFTAWSVFAIALAFTVNKLPRKSSGTAGAM